MLTKSVLTVPDLLNLVAAVWELNQRGQPFTLQFFDAEGKALPVSWLEVAADDSELIVDVTPPAASLTLAQQLNPMARGG